tara:strand:+ start:450 stop:842 length:393 start_codon:yes stop_codon:yes gene_type:complete
MSSYAINANDLAIVLSAIQHAGMDGITTKALCPLISAHTHKTCFLLKALAARGEIEQSRPKSRHGNAWGPIGIAQEWKRRDVAQREKRHGKELARRCQKKAQRAWKPPVFITSIFHYAQNPIAFPMEPRT